MELHRYPQHLLWIQSYINEASNNRPTEQEVEALIAKAQYSGLSPRAEEDHRHPQGRAPNMVNQRYQQEQLYSYAQASNNTRLLVPPLHTSWHPNPYIPPFARKHLPVPLHFQHTSTTGVERQTFKTIYNTLH